MSETDSFIEEVSEEVRRDKLFGLMRKYGWIGIVAVLLVVGGAAYNEWRKATDMAAAQTLGDTLLRALELDGDAASAAALARINAVDGQSQGLVNMLVAAQKHAAGDDASAAKALKRVADDATQPGALRDLAQLKLVLLAGNDMSADERRSNLAGLAKAGGAYRLLAEEQLAMLDIDEGNTEAAIMRLKDIISDVDVTAGLRGRASQLIVVLGGEIDAS
ncbi:tetratricopeptide repeat protein [Profundibacter sp.]